MIVQVFCWCPAQSRPGVQASFTWSLMLSSTCCRLGSGCWRGLGMEMDGYWVILMDATLHWSSHIARWIRLEWIGWWKYVEVIYHLNAPPPHIMAHPSTESWLPYQRTVDLHRWPQHDDLGLRHDARVALCPWGRREPMPGSFLVWDDDELTKFKWGIMGTNWICDSLSCAL